MARLSKEAAPMYGNMISDLSLFGKVDVAEHQELLKSVPGPCRRALRSLMNVAAKERSRNREATGAIEDTAGQIIAARAQLTEVNLVAGRKERRKRIEEWLFEAKVKTSKWVRTLSTGWFYAGKAFDFIEGGEAKIPFEEVKSDARALSKAG
jgi:hypothetical protein